jgi:hypothetical protein
LLFVGRSPLRICFHSGIRHRKINAGTAETGRSSASECNRLHPQCDDLRLIHAKANLKRPISAKEKTGKWQSTIPRILFWQWSYLEKWLRFQEVEKVEPFLNS